MLKLIATDMDGTFLRDDMSYDEARFALIYQQLQSKGIRFVIASGNQYFQLKSFFKNYPELIYVAENGAYIRDNEHVYAEHHFAPATLQTILTKLATIPDLKILLSGVHSAYAPTTIDADHLALTRQYYPELMLVDDLNAVDDDIIKVSISCPPDQTDAIVEQLRQTLDGLAEPTSSGHGDIDVIQLGRNKAAGLSELGKELGVQLSEMAAFGDGGNDLEMLREVGLGVAMANASAAVTAVADQTTTTNQEQGVLATIEDLLKA